tara:strand:+ start:1069 stop:1509 length:441 start_codon:yes stop_codon:yes gene_type:complete
MNGELPNPPIPIGTYATFYLSSSLIYTSGHIPITDIYIDEYIGKVGKEVTIEKAYDASSLICDLTIATILNNNVEISSIAPINVIGYVNAIDTFENHADVLNGFTDKLVKYFPDESLPTRTAVGVASLPKNVCVEIQSIFMLKKDS